MARCVIVLTKVHAFAHTALGCVNPHPTTVLGDVPVFKGAGDVGPVVQDVCFDLGLGLGKPVVSQDFGFDLLDMSNRDRTNGHDSTTQVQVGVTGADEGKCRRHLTVELGNGCRFGTFKPVSLG